MSGSEEFSVDSVGGDDWQLGDDAAVTEGTVAGDITFDDAEEGDAEVAAVVVAPLVELEADFGTPKLNFGTELLEPGEALVLTPNLNIGCPLAAVVGAAAVTCPQIQCNLLVKQLGGARMRRTMPKSPLVLTCGRLNTRRTGTPVDLISSMIASVRQMVEHQASWFERFSIAPYVIPATSFSPTCFSVMPADSSGVAYRAKGRVTGRQTR